ncbi:uncharacterized protein si:ch1073-126c3.2 isoform X2 [Esox lucius]|nr:uncharacterized protein si:ch1073-126c3.2 isoform X2 [Esox lucius]XP_034143588.1 uncharacterized protein si:ch1073-126c3.2 isoform X2 [Esox lucius]XP_034143589.1 uncharacterized protein si:ch1073-126c3.2 isoform X2 [Esox lucius]
MAKNTAHKVLLCFCSAVLSNIVTGNVGANSCSNFSLTFDNFSMQHQEAVQCAGNITGQWNDNQIADLLNSLQTLTDILQENLKQFCQHFKPKRCPAPEPISDGGIVCVSINKTGYCKPMCNEGYDFAFLRRSRLYETCSADTGFKWTTQYVGGNRLAICNKFSAPVAGFESAYFPKDQNCLQTKSNSDLEKNLIKQFIDELKIKDDVPTKNVCLIC